VALASSSHTSLYFKAFFLYSSVPNSFFMYAPCWMSMLRLSSNGDKLLTGAKRPGHLKAKELTTFAPWLPFFLCFLIKSIPPQKSIPAHPDVLAEGPLHWMLVSATLEKKDYKRQNAFLQTLNAAVLRSRNDSSSQILIFDIWNMSLPRALHVDNVHHTIEYYEQLGGLILSPFLKGM
jgi:hypothetical protein